MSYMRRTAAASILFIALTACSLPARASAQEILWDAYGVPHIRGETLEEVSWAFGWAQAQSHGSLLLRLYGQARGRAAEYWGAQFVDSDRWVRVNGIPERARAWVEQADPEERTVIEWFVAGINEYAEQHPDLIDPAMRVILPVTPEDVLAHAQRVVHFTFVASPELVDQAQRAIGARTGGGGGSEHAAHQTPDPQRLALTGLASPTTSMSGTAPAALTAPTPPTPPTPPTAPTAPPAPAPPTSAPHPRGSNAWAIAPSRTADGNALLLINPHLPWADLFTWYEAHISGGGIEAYGVSLVGMPTLNIAFNERLGWAFTVNTYDGADLYRLSLHDGGYAWDGGVRAFDVTRDSIRIRQEDGSVSAEPFDIVRSVHGPVIAQSGDAAVALRVAGLDRPHMMRQLLDMLRAQSFDQFIDALDELQLPMFTVVYADAEGRIMHLFNGAVPRRAAGDFRRWQGVLPGDSSRWLWTDILPFEELPRVIDPPTGWVQNANEPPWTATLPMALDADTFPAWIAPPPNMPFRPQSSARLVSSEERMTLERMVELKHSTRMELAARVVDDAVRIARASDDADAESAADVLAAWDLTADADSRGGVLFVEFWNRYRRSVRDPHPEAWDPDRPLTTPDGLSDDAAVVRALAEAANAVRAEHGRLDVAWGDEYRLRAPGLDLPANGMSDPFGVFRATGYTETEDGRHAARFGDSFVAAVEFGEAVRARALLTYGNATQPGLWSPAQMTLYAEKQLRPVLFTKDEVDANAVRKETFQAR